MRVMLDMLDDELPPDGEDAKTLAFWEGQGADAVPSGFISGLLSACERRAGEAARLVGMSLMRGMPRHIAYIRLRSR